MEYFPGGRCPCSVLSCSDRGDFTGTVLGSVDDVRVVVLRQVQGQTVQKAVLVPQLRSRSLTSLSWRSWSTSRWAGSAVPRVQSVRRQPSSQLHLSYSCLDKVVHTPVVCNDRCLVVQSTANCDVSAVAVLCHGEWDFLGPCTQVQGPP